MHSNKRTRLDDENTDPSSSGVSYVRAVSATSPLKSSPISSLILGDMGLGLLDSDESNQSSIIGKALSTITQPSSALSIIPSENSNDSCSMFAHSETDSNCGSLSQAFSSDIQMPSTDTKIDLLSAEMIPGSADKFEPVAGCSSAYQDNTPANLVTLNRTSFRGVFDTAAHSSGTAFAQQSSQFTVPGSTVPAVGVPADGGRAIRGTTAKKANRLGIEGDKLPRSPLAAIGNAQPPKEADAPKANAAEAAAAAADDFFLYQKRDPRLYTGDDNFARLSDEMLLSVFKWLPKKALIRCSTVNRRFYRVTQDESLWPRLDMTGKTIQPHALYRILSRGVIILRLAQSTVGSGRCWRFVFFFFYACDALHLFSLSLALFLSIRADSRADVRQAADAEGFRVEAAVSGPERGHDLAAIAGATVRQVPSAAQTEPRARAIE